MENYHTGNPSLIPVILKRLKKDLIVLVRRGNSLEMRNDHIIRPMANLHLDIKQRYRRVPVDWGIVSLECFSYTVGQKTSQGL